MKIIDTPLQGLKVIEPKVFQDSRGFFFESFEMGKFSDAGLPTLYWQDNVSRSVKGVLRGLHYQLNPFSQGKIVRVSVGEVFDVAVDLRKGSPTFGRWYGENISAENKRIIWIPPGFAHGFLVLSDDAEFSYKVTAKYAPHLERTILWNDPEIGIQWPKLDIDLILSEKDKKGALLKDAEYNFMF